jgi:putative heme iron utilization protein
VTSIDTKDRELLKHLLTERRVASLAVLVDGKPYASMVPFALTEDGAAVLIHASSLARHSAGLAADAPFALLVHELDSAADENPGQLGRVSLEGTVRPLSRDEPAYASGQHSYLEKFPKSQLTFQLGDFTLYELRIEAARLVAGFAKTFDLTPQEIGAVSSA